MVDLTVGTLEQRMERMTAGLMVGPLDNEWGSTKVVSSAAWKVVPKDKLMAALLEPPTAARLAAAKAV